MDAVGLPLLYDVFMEVYRLMFRPLVHNSRGLFVGVQVGYHVAESRAVGLFD